MAKKSSALKTRRKPPADHRVAGLLRQMRVDAGITQRALGTRLGKPQSWIWNCETGKRRVNVAEFVQWCKGCDLDPMRGFDEALSFLA